MAIISFRFRNALLSIPILLETIPLWQAKLPLAHHPSPPYNEQVKIKNSSETEFIMKEQLITFFKKETILCTAGILAGISAFFIPPDRTYLQYCDLRVLVLLFCLMAVMSGFQQLGLFNSLASALLKKARNQRQLTTILIMLCFFSAMLVTNDVALITFVPFTLLLLEQAGLKEWCAPILVLQTIAANLGSMLTPVGNPQNLYIYTVSAMTTGDFFAATFPLTLLSFLLLCLFCMKQPTAPLPLQKKQEHNKYSTKEKRLLVVLGVLFAFCLLAVFRILPYLLVFALVLGWFLLFQPRVLRKVDYNLLLTFVCFFLLIGNLGRIPIVREALQHTLQGKEVFVAFFASQIISNVPAAVLLSEFTDRYDCLLAGVNIGGLGTLIASMASLISYKYFAQTQAGQSARYIALFTKLNLLFAVVLLAANALLMLL